MNIAHSCSGITAPLLGRFAAAVTAVVFAPALASGVTYTVRVRWQPSPTVTVSGYRIATRAATGASLPVVDAGLPPPEPAGTFVALVSGLDGRTDYEVTVTAYDAGGESAPSNAIGIGYVQVAGRIDTDGDERSDAVEDPNLNRVRDAGETDALRPDTDDDGVGDAADRCPGTTPGEAVDAEGCACGQMACDDGDPCTEDACSPAGCVHIAVPDGVSCSNDDACDGVEACRGGVCTPGTPPRCDDGSACTDDACDPQQGCIHTPRAGCCTRDAECADEDACTTAERCEAGSCVSNPLQCPQPPDGCEMARCEPQRGCVTDPEREGSCDDGNACTAGDTCSAGVCSGTSTAPTSGPRGEGLRRILLDTNGDGWDVVAIGQFPFLMGLDLATSDMTVVFEDGAQRSVLTLSLSGADLQPTRSGWLYTSSDDRIRRLEVRPSLASARVSLRGTLPPFALVDATGASAERGILSWRVTFGVICWGGIELICTDNATGTRQCVSPD